VWAATTVLMLATYSWVDPGETYNVEREGVEGGLSRTLVHVNYPVALAAIAIALVAMGALPRRAWLLAGPAIALCALTAIAVDQSDLDARWRNVPPAVGVLVIAGLTAAATRRAGAGFSPALRGDPARVAIAVFVCLLSLPWITAAAGFHVPGDVFMGEELFRTEQGTLEAAVHLGAHHGGWGALLLLTGLLLSRVRPAGAALRGWLLAANAGLIAYGAVNAIQDFWLEQLWKRGSVDWKIPSAVLPGLDLMTGVWLALAVVAALVLRAERTHT
jgi:hypothetical protein